ncbi:hypothetical protein [Nonomuraea salmonea]|uniref:Uncharacterized protein n=1 Tax=Nonomuraea salmonea TaxID=46181 RepID=A0ABV5NHG9_9ACTN
MDTTALKARHHATDLITAITGLDGDAPVRLHLVTRTGTPAPDQGLPWNELIRIRATEHLPGHAARLMRISRWSSR